MLEDKNILNRTDKYPYPLLLQQTTGVEKKTFSIEIVFRDKGHRETLKEAFRKISDNNGIIKRMLVSEKTKDKRAAFIEMYVDDETNANRITEAIKRIKNIEGIYAPCRILDKIYPCRLYPPLVGVEKTVVYTEKIIKDMMEGFRQLVGPPVGNVVLFQLGSKVGEGLYDSNKDRLERAERISDRLDYLGFLMQTMGWGLITEYEIDASSIRITLVDNWECNGMIEGEGENAFYMKGFFSGFLGKATKSIVQVRVISVKKADDKSRCVFEALRKPSP